MRSWKQRLCGLLLCGAMLASLCPTALAEDVTDQYWVWNEDTKQLELQDIPTDAIEITTDEYFSRNGFKLDAGTYCVTGGQVLSNERIEITGEVHLILANGCELNAKYGIEVSEGNSLTIYAQSKDGSMGKLAAYSNEGAAIGGGYEGSGGNITINGGSVTADGGTGGGAGIGGGWKGGGGNITINGGSVTADGGADDAGIGGSEGGDGGTITICGGEVTATSRGNGAGIGGGRDGDGGEITISGGVVTATSEDYGSGIGGGKGSDGGQITISGGTVTATSKSTGAGIGGGLNAAGGEIAISGGEVTATGDSGAGIGGGQRGEGGEITINGGTVTVQSDRGADIGGGESRPGDIAPSDKIEISGGTVTRPDGGPLNIGSATHQAKDDEWLSDGAQHWHPCEAADCAENHQFNKAPHTPGDWIVDQAATATEPGSRHKECTVCGYTMQTEAIPATGEESKPSGGGYIPPTYKPDVTQPSQGGSVSVSPSSPQWGDTVTVTPRPDEGYEVDKITVTDRDGKPVEVTKKPDGTYTFKQPSGKVTIVVTYKPVETPWNNPFADVSEGDWYYEAVRFVQERGLMNGYGGGNFAPNVQLSRAQLAQILFNKEGRPGVNCLLTFPDVAGEAWYTEAIRWAASQNIVGGYGDGTFGPNDPITREQLAVMLWRYSGSPAATSRGLDFNDESQISGYALEALRWAVENGILNGYGDGRLDPQGRATRAQVAQILKNFIEEETI